MAPWLAKHLCEEDLRQIVPADAHDSVFLEGVDPFERFTKLSWPDTWRLVRDLLRHRGKNVDGAIVARNVASPNDRYQGAWVLPPMAHLKPLRGYQEVSVDAIRNALESSGRALLSLGTGAGKTRIAAEVVTGLLARRGDCTARVVWTAPTREVLLSAKDALAAQWRGCRHSPGIRIDMGDGTGVAESAAGLHVIELVTRAGLRELRSACVDILVVDEVHDDLPRVKAFLNGSSALRLGISATPIRDGDPNSDGTDQLRELFGDPLPRDRVGSTPRQDADGLLREVEHHRLDMIDNPTGLSRVSVRHLADRVSALGAEEQSLVFARDCVEASAIRWCLAARLGTGVAAVVDDRTPSGMRAELIRRFKDGEVRHLISVEVLATGFDVPQVRNIFIARATESPVLYFQMVGRGRRPGLGACRLFDANFDRRAELLRRLELSGDAAD